MDVSRKVRHIYNFILLRIKIVRHMCGETCVLWTNLVGPCWIIISAIRQLTVLIVDIWNPSIKTLNIVRRHTSLLSLGGRENTIQVAKEIPKSDFG